MKVLLTSFTVLLLSTLSFAQPGTERQGGSPNDFRQGPNGGNNRYGNGANLTISTTGSNNLKIRLAGKKYSLQDRSVTFQGMNPGTYTLTIFQLQPRGFGGGSEYVSVFDKTITLTAQRHTEVCVMRFGKVAWDERSIERDDWNENWRNPDPDGQGNNGGNWGNGNNNNNYYTPVDAAQFSRIKDVIARESFDDNKLNTAKAVMKNNWFSAEQLKTLANLFTFDDGKLKFAKFAYDYCADPGNYFNLADVFAFDSNRQDFMKFISSK